MADVKAQCIRCGKDLYEINYVEPDWSGHLENMPTRRPPLCKDCWEIADAEAREAKRKE